MLRLMLSDEHWLKLRNILLEVGIYDKQNLRIIVEGIFYRMRTGIPWRDLPDYFGKWETVYQRFNRWSEAGKLADVFSRVSQDSDPEWSFMDGSYVKAHQHASGARVGEERAIGKSKGGNTSKIHMLVDANGNPIYFEVTGGNTHDTKVAPKLIENMPAQSEYGVGDKGYDSKKNRALLEEKGITPCIPQRNNAKTKIEYDEYIYKLRHLVENIFARLKHFRGIATRYDKLKRNFVANLHLACIFHWIPLSNVNTP